MSELNMIPTIAFLYDELSLVIEGGIATLALYAIFRLCFEIFAHIRKVIKKIINFFKGKK